VSRGVKGGTKYGSLTKARRAKYYAHVRKATAAFIRRGANRGRRSFPNEATASGL